MKTQIINQKKNCFTIASDYQTKKISKKAKTLRENKFLPLKE